MSNNMRHRKEEPKQKIFAVDSAQILEIGDFTFLNADDVRAASDYTWDTDLETTQRSFTKVFAGVAGDQSEAGKTDEVAIETSGIVEMECASATFEVGDLVGLAKATGDNLEDQKVVAVASHDLAIGKVTKRYSSNTTTVYLEIFPRLSQSLMTSDQIIEEIENNTFGLFGLNNFFVTSYTAVSDDATAGLAKIDTGFGIAPDGFLVNVLRSGVDVKSDAIVTTLSGGDLGKIQIADGASTYAVTTGDIIYITSWIKA